MTGARLDMVTYYCWILILLITSIFSFSILFLGYGNWFAVQIGTVAGMMCIATFFFKTKYEFGDTGLSHIVKHILNKTIDYSEITGIIEITDRTFFNHSFETNLIILEYKGKEYGIAPVDKEKALLILKERCTNADFYKESRKISSTKSCHEKIRT